MSPRIVEPTEPAPASVGARVLTALAYVVNVLRGLVPVWCAASSCETVTVNVPPRSSWSGTWPDHDEPDRVAVKRLLSWPPCRTSTVTWPASPGAAPALPLIVG